MRHFYAISSVYWRDWLKYVRLFSSFHSVHVQRMYKPDFSSNLAPSDGPVNSENGMGGCFTRAPSRIRRHSIPPSCSVACSPLSPGSTSDGDVISTGHTFDNLRQIVTSSPHFECLNEILGKHNLLSATCDLSPHCITTVRRFFHAKPFQDVVVYPDNHGPIVVFRFRGDLVGFNFRSVTNTVPRLDSLVYKSDGRFSVIFQQNVFG